MNICNVWVCGWCTHYSPIGKILHKLGSILNERELVYGTLLKSVHQQWQWYEFFNHQTWEMTLISRWSAHVMFVIRVWIRRLLILPANEFWQLKNTSFITDVCCHQNTIIITHEPLIRNSAVKNAARSSPAAPLPRNTTSHQFPRSGSEEELGHEDWLVSDPLLSCFRLPQNYFYRPYRDHGGLWLWSRLKNPSFRSRPSQDLMITSRKILQFFRRIIYPGHRNK